MYHKVSVMFLRFINVTNQKCQTFVTSFVPTDARSWQPVDRRGPDLSILAKCIFPKNVITCKGANSLVPLQNLQIEIGDHPCTVFPPAFNAKTLPVGI